MGGRTVILNAYHGKTDIVPSFSSREAIAYDRRDRERQKQLVRQHMQGMGWRTAELLDQMDRREDFYFDQLCQIRMPAWTRGRVALVGDAGYCPSPAEGMGGSMALFGAAALADTLRTHPGDFATAFADYDQRFRPTVEGIQTDAVEFGQKLFLPSSEEEIQARNAQLNLGWRDAAYSTPA